MEKGENNRYGACPGCEVKGLMKTHKNNTTVYYYQLHKTLSSCVQST